MSAVRRGPSKTVAAWLGVAAGAWGAARFYLHGAGDPWGWLHAAAGLLGGYGAWRMRTLGIDDTVGSMLVPLLGASLASALLVAIVTALMPDARWRERHGADGSAARTGPLAVLAAVLALAGGSMATVATVAFVAQRAFEWTLR